MTTIRQTLDRVNYELRNIYEKQWPEAELFSYLNKCLDLIHQILIDDRSDLNRTGAMTVTTVADQSEYPITDVLLPWKVWMAGYDEMEIVNEDEKIGYEDADGTITTGMPDCFYLKGSVIGFLPAPEAIVTIKMMYYPIFEPAALVTEDMPWLGLFNMQIEEGIKMIAKNRENQGGLIEPALMELYQQRTIAIHRSRRPTSYQMVPYVSGA